MTETQKFCYIVVANGCRWASNIVVELLSNYGKRLSPSVRVSLQKAASNLSEACQEIGK